MRADRLVSLLLYMQGRPRVTAAEIAVELEVSTATARRDLEALSAAGIPVYPQVGRHGGWSLLGGARTDLTGLSAAESRALFSLIGTGQDISEPARSALRKLVRAVPAPFRDTAEAAYRAVVVDAAAWGGATPPEATEVHGVESALDLVRAAVIDRRQLEFDYAGPGRPTSTRTVDPLGLVDKDGSWYLIAGTARGRRTFRLDRVRSLRPTDTRFERSPGFDLGAAWRDVVEEVEARRARVSGTVRLPTRFVFVLENQFGRHCEPLSESDGRSTVRLSASSILDLARTLAGWGGDLVVLEPPALRAELGRIGAELVAASGGDDAGPVTPPSAPRYSGRVDQHVTVRAAQDADVERIDRVVLDAFGTDGVRVLGLVGALRPASVRAELVAEVEGDVVGHVLLSRAWIDARGALVDVLVLSPLAVLPAFQRRGIGGELLGGAFAAAEELGSPAIFLEGDPAYYSRQGFSAAEPLGFERPSRRIPEAAFQVALLEGHEDWMSGRLVYAEPFWAHDCVGLRDPLLGQLGG